ncbi:MAG: hypothetical protein Q8P52_01540 [bacterium]|nr:hypothetical protein [bacterium]
MSNKVSIYTAICVIFATVVVLWFLTKPWPADDELQNATDAIDQASIDINSSVVPPSANPAKDAVPAVNPIEKTNPFKDEYQNPFE